MIIIIYIRHTGGFVYDIPLIIVILFVIFLSHQPDSQGPFSDNHQSTSQKPCQGGRFGVEETTKFTNKW